MSDDPKQVLGPAFFQKAGGVLRGKAPESRSAEREIPQCRQKIRKGRKNVQVGRFFVGEPYQGVPPQGGALPIPPTEKPRQRVETFCCFFSLARLSFVRFCRTASCGEPLDRVPHGRTAHRAVRPPFLILWISREFRALRSATKGSAFGICQPFEKGWTENLVYARCGTYPTGRSNRRRAACRAANET